MVDLIDREALLKVFDVENMPDGVCRLGEIDAEYVRKAIESFPASTAKPPQGWTNAKERQPSEEGWYLTVIEFRPTIRIEGGRTVSTVKWGSAGPDMPTMWHVPILTDVTYWMPLPELPKEDNDGSLH